jgi:hypothetical protein
MIFSVLKSLALGVWLGSLLMLAIAVAGPIFQNSPSRTIAGNINQIILSRMNTIEWICLAIAVVCTIAMLVTDWTSGPRNQRIVEMVMLVIMAALLWYYSSSITGRMTELRAEIKDFDHPRETTEYVQALQEFDALHRSYTTFVGFNMLLIVASFVVTVISVKNQK